MASVATLRDLLEALIESAKEVNKLQRVTSDLETFFKTISSHEDLKKILGSSVFEIEERKDIVGDICEKMGLDHLTLNFIKLIIELEKFKTLINSQEPVIRKLRKVSGTQRAEGGGRDLGERADPPSDPRVPAKEGRHLATSAPQACWNTQARLTRQPSKPVERAAPF